MYNRITVITTFFIIAFFSIGLVLGAAIERPNTEVTSDTQTEVTRIESPCIDYYDCIIRNPITLESKLGKNGFTFNDTEFKRYITPDEVYGDELDFHTFQPFMSYTAITDRTSDAYKVVNSQLAYTDELGMRRIKRDSETEFTVNGEDDYVIALGTFYKDKGLVGNRYLIVTTAGMYTATTGDEKDDAHTDGMNMFSIHGDKAGVIEWIVDINNLNPETKKMGTVTYGGPDVMVGEILYIYEIQ